jgi:hypothetical protein
MVHRPARAVSGPAPWRDSPRADRQRAERRCSGAASRLQTRLREPFQDLGRSFDPFTLGARRIGLTFKECALEQQDGLVQVQIDVPWREACEAILSHITT